METESTFKKIQIKVSLKDNLSKTFQANIVSIEVGYPNSEGNYVWKSSGRLLDTKNQLFLKMKSRSGLEIDAILPSTWLDMNDTSKSFVFDFVKNENVSIIKIKEQILTAKNTNEIKEYEISETDTTFSNSFLNVTITEKIIGTE